MDMSRAGIVLASDADDDIFYFFQAGHENPVLLNICLLKRPVRATIDAGNYRLQRARMQKTAGNGIPKSLKSANDKGERVGRGWIGLCSYKNGKSPAQMLIM
jgi:hypothetical protein